MKTHDLWGKRAQAKLCRLYGCDSIDCGPGPFLFLYWNNTSQTKIVTWRVANEALNRGAAIYEYEVSNSDD